MSRIDIAKGIITFLAVAGFHFLIILLARLWQAINQIQEIHDHLGLKDKEELERKP